MVGHKPVLNTVHLHSCMINLVSRHLKIHRTSDQIKQDSISCGFVFNIVHVFVMCSLVYGLAHVSDVSVIKWYLWSRI